MDQQIEPYLKNVYKSDYFHPYSGRLINRTLKSDFIKTELPTGKSGQCVMEFHTNIRLYLYWAVLILALNFPEGQTEFSHVVFQSGVLCYF